MVHFPTNTSFALLCGELECHSGTSQTHAQQSYRSRPGLVPQEYRHRFDALFLQFHWQDYNDNRYLMALPHLQDLQSEGLIATIGLSNFDAIRTDEICTQLGPDAIVSNQVQVCFMSMLVQLSFSLTHKGLGFRLMPVHFMACQTSAKAQPQTLDVWNPGVILFLCVPPPN
jgi:hypothetical protein